MSFQNAHHAKILVIEDDVYMQAILNEYFNNLYEIEIRNNGIDALSFLQEGNMPDLVISDLNVPQLNGLQLIEQIKASDFFNSIPVMILSGEDSSEMRIKCLNAGADDYVVKPFNPRELEARIKVILRRMGK